MPPAALKLLLKQALPSGAQAWIRRALDRLEDWGDRLRHWNELRPPKRLQFVGSGDFKAVGEGFRNLFIDPGGLQPDHQVLDVGCGVGRMAVPLTRYLSPSGSYRGFDIVREGIEWCQQAITPRHPNFQFRHADIRNRHYNPHGQHLASDFPFPYDDGSFDFVFLTSVFTHMLPGDMAHYLREIARVLKPGGRCFITCFLLDPEARDLIQRGQSSLPFHHPVAHGLTTNPADPEEALAYDEAFLRALVAEAGLQVQHPVHLGDWCNRKHTLSYQDILLATRPGPGEGLLRP